MPMMKNFVWTSARNSETATVMARFMTSLALLVRSYRDGLRRLHLFGRRPGDPDEDVVQRRLRELEMVDRRPLGERDEKRLRIAVQAHVLIVAVVGQRFDPGQSGQRGSALAALDPHGVLSVLRLDLFQRAVEHLMAAE